MDRLKAVDIDIDDLPVEFQNWLTDNYRNVSSVNINNINMNIFRYLPIELREKIVGEFEPWTGKEVSKGVKRVAIPEIQKRECEAPIYIEQIRRFYNNDTFKEIAIKTGGRSVVVKRNVSYTIVFEFLTVPGQKLKTISIATSNTELPSFLQPIVRRRRERVMEPEEPSNIAEATPWIDLQSEFLIRNQRKVCKVDDKIVTNMIVNRYNHMFSEMKLNTVLNFEDRSGLYKEFLEDLILNAAIVGKIDFPIDEEIMIVDFDHTEQFEDDVYEMLNSVMEGVKKLTGAVNDNPTSPFRLYL